LNWPGRTPSIDAGPLGDVGDESPLQAVAIVASVAQDASWHAPAQNWRRETDLLVSDIAGSSGGGARSRPRACDAVLPESPVAGGFPPITNWGCRLVIL
jgi:hypothetical protein